MASGDDRALAPDDLDGSGLRVAIVRARWNENVVKRLDEGVRRGLTDLGVTEIEDASVPGCFEIPFACRAVALSGRFDAIVTIGAVIRGETTHYELVSEEAARGVQQVQLETGVPVAFGLVTVENMRQALARAAGPGGHNVGEEAALVAVEMARLNERFTP